MGFKAKAKAAKPKQPKPKQPKPNPKPKPLKPPPPKEYSFDVSDFGCPDHYRKYIRYLKRLHKCGPFDLDYFLDSSVHALGLIYPCSHKDGHYGEAVDKCVRHAIVYAKKEKNMDLEDPKVVKANHQAHCVTMFYITFDAKDKRSGKRQLYCAKVLFGLKAYRGEHGIDVRLIREKKKSRGS